MCHTVVYLRTYLTIAIQSLIWKYKICQSKLRGDTEHGAGMKKQGEPGELWTYRPGEVLLQVVSSWFIYNRSPLNSVSSLKRLSETPYFGGALRLQ